MYKYSILWSKCFADLGTGWCVLNLERLDKNFGAQVAHGMGAGKVILCDIAPGRLQFCKEMIPVETLDTTGMDARAVNADCYDRMLILERLLSCTRVMIELINSRSASSTSTTNSIELIEFMYNRSG